MASFSSLMMESLFASLSGSDVDSFEAKTTPALELFADLWNGGYMTHIFAPWTLDEIRKYYPRLADFLAYIAPYYQESYCRMGNYYPALPRNLTLSMIQKGYVDSRPYYSWFASLYLSILVFLDQVDRPWDALHTVLRAWMRSCTGIWHTHSSIIEKFLASIGFSQSKPLGLHLEGGDQDKRIEWEDGDDRRFIRLCACFLTEAIPGSKWAAHPVLTRGPDEFRVEFAHFPPTFVVLDQDQERPSFCKLLGLAQDMWGEFQVLLETNLSAYRPIWSLFPLLAPILRERFCEGDDSSGEESDSSGEESSDDEEDELPPLEPLSDEEEPRPSSILKGLSSLLHHPPNEEVPSSASKGSSSASKGSSSASKGSSSAPSAATPPIQVESEASHPVLSKIFANLGYGEHQSDFTSLFQNVASFVGPEIEAGGRFAGAKLNELAQNFLEPRLGGNPPSSGSTNES